MNNDRNFDSYAENYSVLEFEDLQIKFRRKFVIEKLKKISPKSILEVGCGLDSIANHYNDFSNLTIIEPAKKFYLGAVNQFNSKKNIVVRNCLLENFDNSNHQEWDLILVSSVLHEVQDSHSFLRSIEGLCSQDTKVLIIVPNAKSIHRLIAVSMGIIKADNQISETQKKMQQYVTYDKEMLGKAIISAGFEAIEFGTFFLKPFTHSQMSYLYENNQIDLKTLDGLYEASTYFPENGSELFCLARKIQSR